MLRAAPAAAPSAPTAMRALTSAHALLRGQTAALAEMTTNAAATAEEQAVIVQELNANVQRAMEVLECEEQQLQQGSPGAFSPPPAAASAAAAYAAAPDSSKTVGSWPSILPTAADPPPTPVALNCAPR
jgi:hypothetical protein